MVERTAKGKEARLYFIECEKRAKAAVAASALPPALEDPRVLRDLLLQNVEKVIALETKVAEDAPKVEYAEAILNSDGTLLLGEAAKTLGVQEQKLRGAMRDKHILVRGNEPAAHYVTKGYLKPAVHEVKHNSGHVELKTYAKVTGRGLEFLRRFARKLGLLPPEPPQGALL